MAARICYISACVPRGQAIVVAQMLPNDCDKYRVKKKGCGPPAVVHLVEDIGPYEASAIAIVLPAVHVRQMLSAIQACDLSGRTSTPP